MLSALVFTGCSAQFYVNFEKNLSCKKLIQKIWNFYGYQQYFCELKETIINMWDCRDHDRMVVGYTTTYAIRTYHN